MLKGQMNCQCSNIPFNLKIIQVGGSEVGLFDLRETLRAVYLLGIEDEHALKKEPMKRMKETNSIPPEQEDVYAEALLGEFRSFARAQWPVKKQISREQKRPGRVSGFLKRIFGKHKDLRTGR